MTFGDVMIIASIFWCNYWNIQATLRTNSLRGPR